MRRNTVDRDTLSAFALGAISVLYALAILYVCLGSL